MGDKLTVEQAPANIDAYICKHILVAQADNDLAQYPQYKNHWKGDNWIVMKAKKKIVLRGVTILNKGQTVLMNKNSLQTLTAADTHKRANIGKTFAVFYIHVNTCDTSLRLDFFEPYA